ncbi:uncharacterized protein LOC143041816 [Oratosquilla oratoria]|uniref:uncharacterized protein LOC143041816 n=1 Tax=Oratosquilla oratoria TaxID=337810 RepID=UPI003F757FEF
MVGRTERPQSHWRWQWRWRWRWPSAHQETPSKVLLTLVLTLILAAAVVQAIVPEGGTGYVGSQGRGVKPISCPQGCSCSIQYEVVCEGEGIESDLPVLSNLTTALYLAGYTATALPRGYFERHAHRLNALTLTQGQLTTVANMKGLVNLDNLDLSHNNLISLRAHDAFIGMGVLKHLNLSHNSLKVLEEGDFSEVTTVEVLSLAHNPLSTIPPKTFNELTRLRYLDISVTLLTFLDVSWFVNTPEIEFLNASGTRISIVPGQLLRYLPSLTTLDLSYGVITQLPDDSFYSPNSLRWLYMSHNNITYVSDQVLMPLTRLIELDLSYNRLSNLDEHIFSSCGELKVLRLSHLHQLYRIEHGTFTGLHQLEELHLDHATVLHEIEEVAFSGLDLLRYLDMSNSGLRVLPKSLTTLSDLGHLNLEGTHLLCDCHLYWVLPWLLREHRHSWRGVDYLSCWGLDTPLPIQEVSSQVSSLECTPVCLGNKTGEGEGGSGSGESDTWVHPRAAQSALLECNVSANPPPIIIWFTSHQKVFHNVNVTTLVRMALPDEGSDSTPSPPVLAAPPREDIPLIPAAPWVSHQVHGVLVDGSPGDASHQVLSSGRQLLIRNMDRDLVGRYKCFAINPVSNLSVVTLVGMDGEAMRRLEVESLLFGTACAALFLLITLIVQFINYLMDRLGCQCCCCRERLSPKARQVKQLLESIESYKTQQLERLRENYNSQVVNIKDSCYLQMEKLRDSYSAQTKHLKDLRDFSTQQITGLRDQYLDQVNRVRDYSVLQMNRVRENYVFQRHRIRKYSAHQLIKMRETYKYQQKTLNKILENLPDLYLQNCRTGACQRTDSIMFDDELHGLDAYYKVDFFDTQSHGSDYYTPTSTLNRSFKSTRGQHSFDKRHSRTSSNTSWDFQEAQSWISRRESPSNYSTPVRGFAKCHARSFSMTPGQEVFPADQIKVHKRSYSASHPTCRFEGEGRATPDQVRITLTEETSELDLSVSSKQQSIPITSKSSAAPATVPQCSDPKETLEKPKELPLVVDDEVCKKKEDGNVKSEDPCDLRTEDEQTDDTQSDIAEGDALLTTEKDDVSVGSKSAVSYETSL